MTSHPTRNTSDQTRQTTAPSPSSPPSPAVKTILADLDAHVEYDAPIGEMTWYRLGGRAEALVRPRTVDALRLVIERCRESEVPLRVMGSGANLLVADGGVDGIVIRLDEPAFCEVSTIHRHRKNHGGDGSAGDGLRVMAGASMEKLVIDTAKRGMHGLEMMAGIPAQVGGAIRMNAGGIFGSIADAIVAVGTFDLNGKPRVYPKHEIEFGYRQMSILDPVILWAEFRLEPIDPKETHGRIKEIFAYKKKTQPMAEHSAGCVFRNPTSKKNPMERKSAGAIIDRVGLKGHSIGGALISERHANFFVARDGCTANDLIALIEHTRKVVARETGYDLRRELVIWKRRSTEGAI